MLTVTVDDGAATIAAAAITSRSAACMMLLQVTLVSTVATGPATPPGKGLKTALNVMLTCLTVVLGKCLPL